MIYQTTFVEILDLQERLGLGITSMERRNKEMGHHYLVCFDDAMIKGGNGLTTLVGKGKNVDSCLMDYAEKISNKTLVVNPFSRSQKKKEIHLPKLRHTRLLGY